jgi:hypothetical protein
MLVPSSVPASFITNPDGGPKGFCRNFSTGHYYQYLVQEHIHSTNTKLGLTADTVYWDENDPAKVLEVLEMAGKSQILQADRMRDIHPDGHIRYKFDSKALHFDVVEISLDNTSFIPRPWEAAFKKSPMDNLPLDVLLERPGVVFLHVGSTIAGIKEGLRLFKVWKIKRIENIARIATDPEVFPEEVGSKLLSPSFGTCLVGIKGSTNR